MPSHFEEVVSRLGITQDDVEELMDSTGEKDPKKALSMAVFLKAQSPDLPKNPVLEKFQMEPSVAPRAAGIAAEMATGGVGGAISGGTAFGPLGAAGGGLAGAMLPLALRTATGTDGEVFSADRVLDLAGPLVGGGISKLPKVAPIAKAGVNALTDSVMNYATGKANQALGKEDSPIARAGLSGILGSIQIPLMRQAGRHQANTQLLDTVEKMTSLTPAKRVAGKFAKVSPEATQGVAEKNLDYFVQNPSVLEDVGKFRAAATMKGLGKDVNPGDFQKFIKDNPQQIYDYVLKPVVGAKNVDQLRDGAPVFAERLKTLTKLAGKENGEDVAKGLRTSFFDSLATNEKGTRISNPDSFKKRLETIGPEATNLIFNDKEAYGKLVGLSDAASKAGLAGRFMLSFGDGSITVLRKLGVSTPLDKDSLLGGMGAGIAKTAATGALLGPKAAGALAAYEAFKFPVNSLLEGRNKKTLDLLTKGLQLSGNDAVVNKFTEWLKENAEESFRF